MPRDKSSVLAPARFSAVRCPATAASAICPCTCTPRTRTRRPVGKTSISSSRRIVPATSVPVTTVPKPFMVKTRSIGSRAIAWESRGCTSAAAATIARFRSSRPAPVKELTATTRTWLIQTWLAQARLTQTRLPQKCPAQKLFHLQSHHLERLRIHRIGFGEYGDAALHTQQLQDVEVLPRLRLDRFIRRNHQQHQIDPAHTSQHVADETLVPGNVDKAEAQSLALGRGQVHVREAEVNRDAAPLLLLQTVRIDPGQRFHQRSLAVVDVSRRSYNDGFHLAGILPERTCLRSELAEFCASGVRMERRYLKARQCFQ